MRIVYHTIFTKGLNRHFWFCSSNSQTHTTTHAPPVHLAPLDHYAQESGDDDGVSHGGRRRQYTVTHFASNLRREQRSTRTTISPTSHLISDGGTTTNASNDHHD
ncbi:hypothetical protein DEO72_LG9g1397 [Vigna unguiculata]|uniref:Uncharacterized protein n=1 Tax=Vigna unguiculata TaxID=3917 RepID=A0A4D6N2S6_VIGUN|nr:hypothetical protein DEO72_LG9g1397 [Vigna unguiculata]